MQLANLSVREEEDSTIMITSKELYLALDQLASQQADTPQSTTDQPLPQ